MTQIDTNKTYYILLDDDNFTENNNKIQHGLNIASPSWYFDFYENESDFPMYTSEFDYYAEIRLLETSIVCGKLTNKIIVDLVNKKLVADLDIWNDYNECLKIVYEQPFTLRFVKNKTIEIYKIAMNGMDKYKNNNEAYVKFLEVLYSYMDEDIVKEIVAYKKIENITS